MDELLLAGPALVLVVGPAASGKSTVLDGLLADGTLDEVISTDAIRVEHGLDLADTTSAYALAYDRLRRALRAGRLVALDATNVRAADRAPLHVLAARERVDVIALRVGDGLSLADLVARDAGRDRHVPVHVLRSKLVAFRAESSRTALAREPFAAVADVGCTRLARRPAPLAVPA